MIITKKVLRNVSLTAHPLGCKAYVEAQVERALALAKTRENPLYQVAQSELLPKRVVVIGGSTGYGLSARVVSAFVGGAATINISVEREPSETKTATPGYYNTHYFEQLAQARNLKSASLFGDAFASETRKKAVELIADLFGQVDLLVFSLASPRRIDAQSGHTYHSVLKPIGQDYEGLSVDVSTGMLENARIEAATNEQVEETVKVMGGEVWEQWIEDFTQHNLLAPNFTTVAFSYLGPELTYPIYQAGTIGKAKEDLERSAHKLSTMLASSGGAAYVSVNKALVTRASAVIPVVPLYIALLYQVMKEEGVHENCTDQMYRLLVQKLYRSDNIVPLDEQGRIRLDDWEMEERIQARVHSMWQNLRAGEMLQEGDLAGFIEEFDQMHGFGFAEIDYTKDIDPRVD